MGCFSCTGTLEGEYEKEHWKKRLINNHNDVNTNNNNNYHNTRRAHDHHHHHRRHHVQNQHQHQHQHLHPHQHHGHDGAAAASTSERVKPNDNDGNAKDSGETKEEVPMKKELDFDMDLNNVSKDRKSTGKEAQKFTFSELAAATRNFSLSCFIGEGGFGIVYKGHLAKINQVVAIKQLDLNGLQGTKEFLVEVAMLSLVDHPNLVKLIGYCAEKDQRLLVYEYMPLGSLDNHLHDLPTNEKGLDWRTRMKIAAGAATGLEYLHEKVDPPIIYRDLKCSNILLGEDFHPKLSDFGLAKIGPRGDNTHVSTRVMGTYGYCAPEYAMTGQLTFKSDIYSFGVVLLELITGRKAFDPEKSTGEQNLVAWARPLFRDRKKFPMMADPRLEGKYPVRGFYQALAIAAMCLQEQPNMRPAISHVVKALNYLSTADFISPPAKDAETTSSIINMEHKERATTSTPKKEPEERVGDDKVKGKEKVEDHLQ